MSGTSSWLAAAFLCAIACVQQPLIERAALNQGRFHDIVDRASRASGLRVMTPLSVELVTRRQLHDFLNQYADAEVPSDERVSAEAAMGLRSTPRDAVVGLLSRVTRGLYLPRTRTLYLISELPRGRDGSIQLRSFGELDNEVTLAHEIVHALQHQHYPQLFDPGVFPKHQADAAAALQAAIEGAATFAAVNTLGFMGTPRDPDEVISGSPPFGPLDAEDPLVRERMSFPYTYGYRIAYEEGETLLESPPASTEQVLHLDWRGRRRPFSAIDLSKVSEVLEAQGCRDLSEDTMGELGISLWLRDLRPGIETNAAEGWDGDRWIALECADGNGTAWLTTWDTREDAIEFEQAIESIAGELQRRAVMSSRLVSNRNEREVIVVSTSLPIGSKQVRELASRARVTTREELAAHFRNEE